MADEDNPFAGLSDADVRKTAARFESVPAATVNAWLIDLLPEARIRILDLGAGSGRDAAWLAALGHDVVAVEPDRAMRHELDRWHPNRIFRLLDDRLPDLPKTVRAGFTFEAGWIAVAWHPIPGPSIMLAWLWFETA